MKHSVSELKERVAVAAVRAGIPQADAKIISDVLVTTDMRGVHSHGLVRLARYIDCIRAGGIKPDAEMQILKESASSLMVGAAGGLGIPVARKTMDRLLVKAETAALGMSGMMSGVHSWNTQPGRDANTGHTFIVINPEFFGGREAFKANTDKMIDELKRCPRRN